MDDVGRGDHVWYACRDGFSHVAIISMSVWDDPVNIRSSGLVPLDWFCWDRDRTGVSEMNCPYCGRLQHTGIYCPLVKSLEYHPDGRLKRVEFKDERGSPDYRSTPITGVTTIIDDDSSLEVT